MAGGIASNFTDKLVKTLPADAFEVLSNLLLPPFPGKDWQSLAGYLGFTLEEIRAFSSGCEDPVLKVLTRWTLLKHELATIGTLVCYLNDLGRLDVIEDISPYFAKALDVEQYKAKQLEFQSTSKIKKIDLSPVTLNESYDVFISYARADVEFAKEILTTLEGRYHITACIDFRDFLPGVHHLEQIVEVIEERCRKVLVILSEDYVECEKCDFQAKVAMSLSAGWRRILIPVLYKPCKIPAVLKGLFFLNFADEDYRTMFWEKLTRSIKGK